MMSSMEEKIEQLMTTVTESKSAVEDQIRSMREEPGGYGTECGEAGEEEPHH